MADADKLFDAMKLVRQAVEIVEVELQQTPAQTREYAKLQLARHHLIDAVTLASRGEIGPDTMIWAWGCIDKIATEGKPE